MAHAKLYRRKALIFKGFIVDAYLVRLKLRNNHCKTQNFIFHNLWCIFDQFYPLLAYNFELVYPQF